MIDPRSITPDLRPALGLWAPGNYHCHCRTCAAPFIGDKRALECADCAYSLRQPPITCAGVTGEG